MTWFRSKWSENNEILVNVPANHWFLGRVPWPVHHLFIWHLLKSSQIFPIWPQVQHSSRVTQDWADDTIKWFHLFVVFFEGADAAWTGIGDIQCHELIMNAYSKWPHFTISHATWLHGVSLLMRLWLWGAINKSAAWAALTHWAPS